MLVSTILVIKLNICEIVEKSALVNCNFISNWTSLLNKTLVLSFRSSNLVWIKISYGSTVIKLKFKEIPQSILIVKEKHN